MSPYYNAPDANECRILQDDQIGEGPAWLKDLEH